MEVVAVELPRMLVATTLNVYGVVLASAFTVARQVAGAPLQALAATVTGAAPPPDVDTVYEMIGLPPSSPGTVHVTLPEAFAAVALTTAGGEGTVWRSADTSLEGSDSPAAFTAATS